MSSPFPCIIRSLSQHFPEKEKNERSQIEPTRSLLEFLPTGSCWLDEDRQISRNWVKKIWSRGLELLAGSSKPNVTVIADARETSTPSSEPDTRMRFPIDLDRTPPWNTYRHTDEFHSPNHLYSESMHDQQESTNILMERDARVLSSVFPTCPGTTGNSEFPEETVKGVTAYPPFPCPFCDRAYTSWGFRRRHIKAVHTISPSLNCKWCLQVRRLHQRLRLRSIRCEDVNAIHFRFFPRMRLGDVT